MAASTTLCPGIVIYLQKVILPLIETSLLFQFILFRLASLLLVTMLGGRDCVVFLSFLSTLVLFLNQHPPEGLRKSESGPVYSQSRGELEKTNKVG